MKVEFSADAKAELRAARDHYESEAEGLGREFVLEMRALQRQIALLPLRFPAIPGTLSRRASGKRFPYMLVFSIEGKIARILAVAHQHRRPLYWQSGS